LTREYTASISRDGDLFVAQCLEVDVASQGDSESEALANLREALELYFESPQPTDAPRVTKLKITVHAA
jgi:predicted RNase H-like HicB family nuclease